MTDANISLDQALELTCNSKEDILNNWLDAINSINPDTFTDAEAEREVWREGGHLAWYYNHTFITNLIKGTEEDKEEALFAIQIWLTKEHPIILNFTPHPIHLLDKDNNVIRTFNSMGVVRCEQRTESAGSISGVPLTRTKFGKVDDRKMKYDNCAIYYIVSRLVMQELDRDDLLVPNELVRDGKGHIIGCRSFAVN